MLINERRLGDVPAKHYPGARDYATDKVPWQYIQNLKNQFLRNTLSINKVTYDNKTHMLKNTLSLHTAVSCVQGGKLKAKAEVRVATVFRNAPEPFLCMIVAHKLARLKKRERNKAFYQLYCHMEPQYHRLEFDTRLWLTQLSFGQDKI